MKKSGVICLCLGFIVCCALLCVGLYGAMSNSKPETAQESTDVTYVEQPATEIGDYSEEKETEQSITEVRDYSSENAEMVAEEQSESADRAEALTKELGSGFIKYDSESEDVDIPDEAYNTITGDLLTYLYKDGGSDSMPITIKGLYDHYGSDMSAVHPVTDVYSGVHVFDAGVSDSLILYFSDNTTVLAIWFDALYMYTYDCTNAVSQIDHA